MSGRKQVGRGRRGDGGGRRNDGRGGRGRGRHDGRGSSRGWGRNIDMSGMRTTLTNKLPAQISPNFSFYEYSVDCKDKTNKQIDGRRRRLVLFLKGVDNICEDMPIAEKDALKRVAFFEGSFFSSGRPIPGLEKKYLPRTIADGSDTNGDSITVVSVKHLKGPDELQPAVPKPDEHQVVADTFRCNDCLKTFKGEAFMLQHCSEVGHSPVYPPTVDGSATLDRFLAYSNSALQRAMAERLKRWGDEYIDESKPIPFEGRDKDLQIQVYQAFSCKFGIMRRTATAADPSTAQLTLTVDLRAKILRTVSVLDALNNEIQATDRKWSNNEMVRAEKKMVGSRVMYKLEKKGYTVVGLDFNHSPRSLPVPGLNMSHEEYFKRNKKVTLEYPDHPPMVVVLGRQGKEIYLPPELVFDCELEPRVRERLPMVASFKPEVRSRAIDQIRAFLAPGAHKTRGKEGMLPSLGINLKNARLQVGASVLGVPQMMAAGVRIPDRAENWAPVIDKAKFKVEGKQATVWNVCIFHSGFLSEASVLSVYSRICHITNSFNSVYRLGAKPHAIVSAGKEEKAHLKAVTQYFSRGNVPSNIFFLEFVKPKGKLDPCYPVVKEMLAKGGHLSQFLNFKTYSHDRPQDQRKSNMILAGVCRQILAKSGVALWWVSIPKEIPLPVLFVGVDVFHSPPVYNPRTKKRERKSSCAAIIVQLMREHTPNATTVELYSETFKKEGGQEFALENAYKQCISNALRAFKVTPASCVVWRDGISDSSFDLALDEIRGVRAGLSGVVGTGKSDSVPLAFITCQKRINEKYFAMGIEGIEDGTRSAPPGTMVSSIQTMQYQTFYINGRAPQYSTAKPVRFVVIQRDDALMRVPISQLTWSQMHAYYGWTGSIKVPSVCQMAHKCAELAGGMPESGFSIDHSKHLSRIYFL